MGNDNVLILHISDLHFGDNFSVSASRPDFTYEKLAEKISLHIKEKYQETKIVIALSGDVANKGNVNKYQESLKFLRGIENVLSTDKEVHFIICPGNHDLNTKPSTSNFHDFNKFTYKLIGTDDFCFGKEHSIPYEIFNWSFILLNTQYHLDHTYGLIDIGDFNKRVLQAKHPVIVLMHHNLIPIFGKKADDTIRNSYGFIQDCLKENVKLILHGHVHSSFKLSICNTPDPLHIIGVGAPLPELKTNYNNQFNVIILEKESIKTIDNYKFSYDSVFSSEPEFKKYEIL